MNSLFDQEVKISKSILALILLGGAFYMFTHTNTLVNFFIILLAGLVGAWLVFGTDGIKKIFSKPKKGSFKIIILSLISSLAVGIILAIVAKFILKVPTAANPVGEQFAGSLLDSGIMLFKTIFMLSGEEIIVILPLIIIVSLLVNKTKISKKVALIISTIVTAIMFGSLHLPTYQWNLFQCFGIIAMARVPFTIASLKSNSMVSGIICHISYDWLTFVVLIISQLK